MRFRKPGRWFLAGVAILSMLLAACSSQSSTPAKKDAAPAAAAKPATPAPAPQAPAKAAAAATLRIGASVGVTGIFATEGKEQKQAYDIWKDYVNEKGGIKVGDKNHKVDIIYYDDKSDAETAAKLVEKLITEDKVNMLFGPYSSGITQAASAISDRYKVIMAASNACSDQLYKIGRKYLFTPMSPCSYDFHNLVTVVKGLDANVKTAAVVSADNLAALMWAEGAKDFSEKSGLKVTSFTKYPMTVKDVSSMVTDLKAQNPDILFIADFIQNSILWVRQMKDLGFLPKAIGFPSTTTSMDFVNALGKDAEGVFTVGQFIATAPYKDPVFGTLQNYMELLKKAGQNTPNDRYGSGSGAGVLLQAALEKAGTVTDTEKIREALLTVDIKESIYGPIKLDPSGVNLARKPGVLQVQGGNFQVVYPAELAKAKATYPLAPWNKR